MEIELYKSRSYSGCIKSAYILFSTNLTTIFKRTWLSILVYSIPLAIMIDLSLSSKALNEADLPIPTTTLVLMSGMCIWSLAGCIWFIAIVNRILNTRTLKANLIRATVLILILLHVAGFVKIILQLVNTLVVSTFLSAKVSSGAATLTSTVIEILLDSAFFVALLPCTFSIIKYLIEPQSKISDIFGKAYRHGWRHWGFLFITLFITGIIFCLIATVLFAPFGIIVEAQISDLLGTLNGDPSGIPSNFYILLYGTTLLTSFIFAYLVIWSSFVFYYAYGSIETTEREREKSLTA